MHEEAIGDRVDAHFAAILPGGGPYELERFAGYRLHQRSVERMRVGRVLLAERTCAELRRMIEDPVAFRERLTFPVRLRSSGAPPV